MLETVWVFNGMKSSFPSAVFHTEEDAVQWIRRLKLSGTLTEYPVGISVYDWVIGNGYWQPKRPDQKSPEFIAGFSSAHQDHDHFEDGERFAESSRG
ncbi:MAG: DUF7710 domain-containing protein [Armatimonadota bacterium]